MKKLKLILIFFVLNFGALAIGSLLMNNGPVSDWYMDLNKAPWTPPGWVFGVAWTTIMFCFSFYMAKLVQLKNEPFVWILFFVQFFLNISWNYVFFNQHMILSGFTVIIALTAVVAYFMFKYNKLLQLKTGLIAPYFIWLLIASSLNGYVLFNN